jgi:hypothetical protein
LDQGSEREIIFEDLERAVEARDPELVDLVVQYASLPDPPPGQPELPPDGYEPRAGTPRPPAEDEWTMPRLARAVSPLSLENKTATERKALRKEAWDATLAAPNPPPRLRLGRLLVDLYEANDARGRTQLIEIFRRVHIAFGVWQGMKRIYKRAEENHDAAIFGVLAARFDLIQSRAEVGRVSTEISPGTFVYLARRAWRFMRHVGQAIPEMYPELAARVLASYPIGVSFQRSWIANQIWAHADLVGKGRSAVRLFAPPKDLARRAFDEAWKTSPEPLLRLLEDAENDLVTAFAIRSLEKDHAEALRKAEPRWIARLARKPLASMHDFLVKILSERPEFHGSKLRELQLHETVLLLLGSPSAIARKYALEYARLYAADMSVADLVRWVIDGTQEVKQFAAERLAQKPANEIPLEVLAQLLGVKETAAFATERIRRTYKPQDIGRDLFVLLAIAGQTQRKFLADFYESAKMQIPAGHWTAVIDHPEADDRARDAAIRALAGYSGEKIGLEWLKKALHQPKTSNLAAQILRGGTLAGSDLDVEWVKGLVSTPRFRNLALEILGNPKIVAPSRAGLDWLLLLLRHGDEEISGFAKRHLLEHFAPEDFDPSRSIERGIARLWSLAAGRSEPEIVRAFAATYLKAHHPEIGPALPEARALGIQPKLDAHAYTIERVGPLFSDERADVRRLGGAIAKQDIVRWNDPRIAIEMADSAFRETRAAAAEILLAVGEADADPAKTPPVDWLAANDVFRLAESPWKASRELALTLIRRHYDRVGGATRLARLMESPDREVRLFAVRLLWEKHRGPVRAFEAHPALEHFLRTTLFGLPPGRMEKRELGGDDRGPDRALPASIAKHRLLEVIRDFAIEDVAFARLVLPILKEFTHSSAKGEWQSAIAALAFIAEAHPSLAIDYGQRARS